jgi:hypothetical protein
MIEVYIMRMTFRFKSKKNGETLDQPPDIVKIQAIAQHLVHHDEGDDPDIALFPRFQGQIMSGFHLKMNKTFVSFDNLQRHHFLGQDTFMFTGVSEQVNQEDKTVLPYVRSCFTMLTINFFKDI